MQPFVLYNQVRRQAAAGTDIPPGAAVELSFRKFRTAYAGQCVRLRRVSDDAELDFGFTVGDVLDTAAITTWLGGSDGRIRRWYDQSGNGADAVQATAADQPILDVSGAPVVLFQAAGTLLNVTFASAVNDAAIYAVAEINNTGSGLYELGPTVNSHANFAVLGDGSTYLRRCIPNADLSYLNSALDVRRIWSHVVSKTAAAAYEGRTLKSSSADVVTTWTPTTVMRIGGWDGFFSTAGKLSELIVYPTAAQTPARRAAIWTNLETAYP